MFSIRQALWVVAIGVGIIPSAWSMGHEIVKNDKFSLTIGGRIQMVGYGQQVEDPARPDSRVYLFLKQARLNFNGDYEGIKYNNEWVGGAEDVNGSNTGLTLLDFSFDIPVYKTEATWFKIGQFKVPYGRESITDEAQTQFAENSVNYKAFNLGRDYGAAMHTYKGKFAGAFGLFTGGARDVPLRFLPENLGVPMTVLRLGYNDGLDKDIFAVAQNDLNPVRTTKAAYVNAMFFKDSEIGHSTVLGSRTSEKSWIMNANWNPYITRGAPAAGNPAVPSTLDRADFYQVGWDAAARGRFTSGLIWSTEAQMDYAKFANIYGHIENAGVRVQGALMKNKVEVALRYSGVLPDDSFVYTYGGRQVTNKKPIHEVAPAVTYYVRGHDFKIVADAPVLINVPVFVENNVGSYVATEQPDQASLVTGRKGYMERMIVPEVRVMFQLAF